MRSSRRHALSFLISAGTHALLLLLVVTFGTVLVPNRKPLAKRKDLAVEIVTVPRPHPQVMAQESAKAEVAAVPAGLETRAKVHRKREPAQNPERVVPTKEIPLRAEVEPTPEPGFVSKFSRDVKPTSPPIDLKSGIVFRPRRDLPPGTNPWGGTTTRNGPGAEPDHDAVVAEAGRLAQSRVGSFVAEAREMQAHERVETGLIDDYFRTLRHSLEKATKHPPPFGTGSYLGDLGNTIVNNPAYKNYARTGNPYPDQDAPLFAPTPLGGVGMGNSNLPPAQTFNFSVIKGEGGGLEARVEMWQAVDGKLLKLSLVKSSGNKDFDAHVVHTAPDALKDLPPPPPDGAGIHPDGIHSLWAFQGKISYMRSAKNVDMKKDWAGVAAAAIPSLLSGMPFDETTGDVYVLDPSNPEFVVKVHLLAVY